MKIQLLILPMDIVSGITNINLRFKAEATKANPIPVFPLVDSINMVLLFIFPEFNKS